jgi:hypothetical protein
LGAKRRMHGSIKLRSNSRRRMVLVTRIEASDGKWVVEVGTEQHEFLAPTTVSRLDRRLGLKSPFASLP